MTAVRIGILVFLPQDVSRLSVHGLNMPARSYKKKKTDDILRYDSTRI